MCSAISVDNGTSQASHGEGPSNAFGCRSTGEKLGCAPGWIRQRLVASLGTPIMPGSEGVPPVAEQQGPLPDTVIEVEESPVEKKQASVQGAVQGKSKAPKKTKKAAGKKKVKRGGKGSKKVTKGKGKVKVATSPTAPSTASQVKSPDVKAGEVAPAAPPATPTLSVVPPTPTTSTTASTAPSPTTTSSELAAGSPPPAVVEVAAVLNRGNTSDEMDLSQVQSLIRQEMAQAEGNEAKPKKQRNLEAHARRERFYRSLSSGSDW